MNLNKLISELKRRNVFKVATAYAIVGWLIVQVVTAIEDPLSLPEWFDSTVIVLVAIGFPIVLLIAWAFELTPDGLKKTEDVEEEISITKETGKKINRITIISLSLVIVFLLTERIFFATSRTADTVPEPVYVDEASIAVLPFVNMSSDEENEYFSDGLSEELLNNLARIKGLRVAARTSSFSYKGKSENLTTIAEQLGVDHVIEGSVRKDANANTLRITVQLIKADSGFHLWSKTYDRELSSVFAIQEDISRKIAGELKVKLLPEEESIISSIPTTDVEAYNLYLQGTQLENGTQSDDFKVAINKYKQAVKLDPGFALAYARMAWAYGLWHDFGDLSLDSAKVLMRGNIDKALLINGNLGEAYRSLGYLLTMSGSFRESVDALERALELIPNDASSWGFYGSAMSFIPEDYTTQDIDFVYTKAYKLDPLNPLIAGAYALTLRRQGKSDEAIALYEEIIERYPDHGMAYLGISRVYQAAPFGQLDRAFELLFEGYKLYPEDVRILIGLTSLARNINFMELATHFESILEAEYPDNASYYLQKVYNGIVQKKYSEIEQFYIDKVLGRYDSQIKGALLDQMSAAYFYQAKYDEGITYIEEVHPGFKEEDVEITGSNSFDAFRYIMFLEAAGEDQRAEQMKESVCNYVSQQINDVPEDSLGIGLLNGMARCSILSGEYDKAISIYETLYYKKNLKTGWPYRFTSDLVISKLFDQPEYEAFKEKIFADLGIMKGEVIAFLKEEGDWQEEWEESVYD